MPETYDRERHESLLKELESHTVTLRELESKPDLTHEEREYLKELRFEEEALNHEHERMLSRAWDEAIQQSLLESVTDRDREEYRITNESWRNNQETAYQESKERFQQLMVRIGDALEGYHDIDLTAESYIPGVSEVNIKGWGDTKQEFFDVRFTYPKLIPHEPVGSQNYETGECVITVTQDGALVAGWEHAPLALKAHERGMGIVLDEVGRIFEDVGYPDVPVFMMDEDLVPEGEGTGEPKSIRGKGEQIEGVDTPFAATERFKILHAHGPLFVCHKAYSRGGKVDGKYSAFVYDDIVIFDSLRYGNGIYFLKDFTPISEGEQYELRSIDHEARERAMEQVLKRIGFYEEIKKTRTERRLAGRRFPTQHPPRPEDSENQDYKTRLEEYYNSLFAYVRGGEYEIENGAG